FPPLHRRDPRAPRRPPRRRRLDRGATCGPDARRTPRALMALDGGGAGAAYSPPPYAQVAQLAEQGTENPRVGGSIPPLGTNSSPGIAPVFSRLSSLQYRSPCFGLRAAEHTSGAARVAPPPPTEIAVLVSMARRRGSVRAL